MRGAHRTLDTRRAPQCACKYCDYDGTNRKQSAISRELRVGRKHVLARINEPDEAGAGHTDDSDSDGNVNAGTHVDVAHADAVIAGATSVVPVT